jgi:cytochrome c peroxidase
VVRSLYSTERARSAALGRALQGVLLVCVLLVAARVSAHEGEAHGSAALELSEPEAARGAFATPLPGSYALPPLGDAADGVVLTSAGESVSLYSLFGDGVVLLSFIYTRCSDAEGCPLATAVLHGVGARVGRAPDVSRQLRLLSLSFDPENDTPEVMQAYGRAFARDGADWRFLTSASEADLAPLLSSYAQTRIPEVDESGEETGGFTHLLRVFLIDRERRIRQVYSASLMDPDALLADVKTLLLEEGRLPQRQTEPQAIRKVAALVPMAITSGPGDPRQGYETAAYTTRSVPLEMRQGRGLDLAMRVSAPPLGLPPVAVPADNPVTAKKVALGRRLFFDRRLSLNDTISCAMCHIPEQGFASNEMATAIGIEGRTVRRNAPTLFNVAYVERLFHDGRETRLEQQVWGPLLASNEMGNPAIGRVIEKVRALDDYAQLFAQAFPGRGLGLETLGMALASYERTLVSGDSDFDRYQYAQQEQALTAAAKRGLALFTGKAGCVTCHPVGAQGALFSDQSLHNTGVGYASSMQLAPPGTTQRVQVAPGVYLDVPRSIIAQVSEKPPSDLGLYEITQDPRDRWKYRTPGLRNVALTAPYMHDGSLATLPDVVAFYARGGIPNENLDPLIRPLDLSEREQRDLVAFLESLTGSDVPELVADAFAAPVSDR